MCSLGNKVLYWKKSKVLGAKRGAALLGFHVFTGCDQTWRFHSKSKTTWWNHFIKADKKVLNAFACLGLAENLPSLETLELLEKFVVSLYGGTNHPSNIRSLADIRWYLFSKLQFEAKKLPPTSSVLKYKIFRTHFITMVLRCAHLLLQNLPEATNFGWEIQDTNDLVPILADNLPAPLTLLELSSCSCKSGCNNKRCKCRKNDFSCRLV